MHLIPKRVWNKVPLWLLKPICNDCAFSNISSAVSTEF